jgi:hypothetical protein
VLLCFYLISDRKIQRLILGLYLILVNSYAFQSIVTEAEQLQVLISVAEELVSEKFRELVV